MKTLQRSACLLFFFCLLGFSPLALANEHAAGLAIGQVWPSGDIANGDVDSTLGPQIFYEYEASDIFSLFANAMPLSHTDGRLKVTTTSLGIKANLIYYDKLSPYAFFGMGLNFVNKEFVTGGVSERAKKTLFGLNLGVGADLDINETFFAGMAFSLYNLFSNSVTLPRAGRVELSGREAGLFLRAGVRF